jgi:Cu+-exporting ATPase
MGKVEDVVCEMTIDPKEVAATSEYKGVTYYFCARGCKVALDKDPEKYLQGDGQHEH